MIIRIVVDDKLIAVDNRPVKVEHMDWAVFSGDPASPWDDIFAVQYDGASGQGHVEYREIVTSHAYRPNIRPPDRRITKAEFEAEFSWVIAAYYEAKEAAEAAQAAKAAADAEAREASAAAGQGQSDAPAGGFDAASSEQLELLQAQLAEMNAKLEAQARLSEALTAVVADDTPENKT